MASTASSTKSSVRENSPRRRFRVFQAGRAYGVENRAIAGCARDDFKMVVSGAAAPDPRGKPHRQIDSTFEGLSASSAGARLCL